MKSCSRVLKSLALLIAAGFFVASTQAITVDGTRDGAYGSALAVQTVNTGFGDSSYTGSPNGPDANGSELDAGYGIVSGGYLYLFLAGNTENNGNHVNVFISDGRAGQSTLAVPATGAMQAMNGSMFSPGFSATVALDLNNYQGTAYVEEYSLVGSPAGGYVGSFGLAAGIGSGSPGGVILYGLNNSNTGGVNGSGGTAANAAAAQAVTTGLEIAIPLSLLGNPTGTIKILADINGGGDGYLSNQFLPGLPVGAGNVGTAGFNFSSTPGQYFVVSVPEPSSLALLGLSGLGLFLARRQRK